MTFLTPFPAHTLDFQSFGRTLDNLFLPGLVSPFKIFDIAALNDTKESRVLSSQYYCFCSVLHKGGSRILARGVHMSDGDAKEAQSLYVSQTMYKTCF